MVLEKLRNNSRKIGGICVLLLLLLAGLFFVGPGPVTDLLSNEEKPTPNATVSFEKKFEGNNINMEVVFTNATQAEKIVVKRVNSSTPNKTIHRVNSYVAFEDLEHGDTLKAYAVSQGQWKEVGSHTIYVNRNPQATLSYTQEYDENADEYTVTATLESAPAVDYITAISAGEFTSSSGDSQDYDGDGNTVDDINIIQKRLQIKGLTTGDSIIIVGKVDGKFGIIDSYTIQERPSEPEIP